MSPTLHRINIDQWRSSVPNTTESLTVPPLVGGRFPSHARPLPPPNPTDFNNLNLLHHSSSSTSTSNRPSLLNLTVLTSSSSDEEVESRSGSEMISERSGKKEEADRLVDSTLELLLSVWPSPPSSLAALTPPVSTTSSDSGTDSDQDAVPLRTFVNEILRRSRSSCATLRAARLYLERAATLLPPGQERKSTLACPRRTFLSSLILANKFLHDRVYSNRAWGKVSGLQVREISQGETALGDLLGWALWVGREPGTFNAAVDLELGANAPALIPIPDYYETSIQQGHDRLQRLKRGRSSSSSNVFLGRSTSSEPTTTTSSSRLVLLPTSNPTSNSAWGRTTSLPSITLNGGGLDSIFTSPSESLASSSILGAPYPVAPLPRIRSVFTTLSSFTDLSASLSSLGTSSSIEEEAEAEAEESSESEVESEMGTVEDSSSSSDEQHQHQHQQGQGQPMRKRQRMGRNSVEVVDGGAEAEASQLDISVAWALGLGVLGGEEGLDGFDPAQFRGGRMELVV